MSQFLIQRQPQIIEGATVSDIGIGKLSVTAQDSFNKPKGYITPAENIY